MALKATIYKADLQIADMDRNYYAGHALTIARHPSENDGRMMARLLAFALNANESLAFTKGLCDNDEPDIWQKDLTGAIELWIELGQPDEKRLRQACGKAGRVQLYCYSGRSAEIWWEQNSNKARRFENLAVANIPVDAVQALAGLANRSMQLQCTIQDGQIWLADQLQNVSVELEIWKR
ncbi:MAG: YaeQ family protein [Formivibrio sp.]|nr:YaeQ family protein [Formivibrio sp.]